MGGKNKLDADLESSAEVQAEDAAFTPAPDAKEDIPVMITGKSRINNAPIVLPTLIQKVEPDYPLFAKSQHITGVVVIKAVIGKDGRIKNAEVVSSPHPILSLAALAAVRQWLYKPCMLNGEPVELDTQINLAFRP